MTPKCLACINRRMIVSFTETGRAGRRSSLGGKVMTSLLDCICFEVTVIHPRRAVRQADIFIDLELNKKYGLGI